MSEADLETRPATPDDARALAALWIESAEAHVELDPRFYVVPETEAAIRRAQRVLADPSCVVLLAISEARIVGACQLRRLPPPGAGGMVRDLVAMDVGIVVSAEHRGRGIARSLMAEAESHAAREGVELMTLNARRDNAAAIGLYRAAGYEEVGVVMSRWIG